MNGQDNEKNVSLDIRAFILYNVRRLIPCIHRDNIFILFKNTKD